MGAIVLTARAYPALGGWDRRLHSATVSRDRMRTLGLAAVLAAIVLVPLAIWAGTSLSEDEADDALAVQSYTNPSTRQPEVIVFVTDEELNAPETVDGAASVGLECLDAEGEVQFRVEHGFPFTDTDDGTEPPHVHQQVSVEQASTIQSCRLADTDPPLEGELDAGESF